MTAPMQIGAWRHVKRSFPRCPTCGVTHDWAWVPEELLEVRSSAGVGAELNRKRPNDGEPDE